jgi:hypothetical protein
VFLGVQLKSHCSFVGNPALAVGENKQVPCPSKIDMQ